MTDAEVWVDTQERLDEFLSSIDSVVAVDTEFVRRTTFFHEPALLQLAVPGSTVVVDLLAPLNLSGVERVLADQRVTKVVHGSSEDLELLRRCFGFEVTAWVDLQIAMSLISTEAMISYSGLVERLFGESLPKGKQNSKWLKRPLDADQIAYAAMDVRYLIEIWQQLRLELVRKGRLSWFEEDMRVFLDHAEDRPGLHYRSISGATKLDAKRLSILRGLCEIRFCFTRTRNLPQNWIATDKDLLFLAEEPNARRREVIELFGRKKGERLLLWLQRAIRYSKQDRVESIERTPRGGKRVVEVAAEMRQIVVKLAEELSVATSILATNSTVNEWVRNYLKEGLAPTHITNWRNELVAKRIENALQLHGSRQS